MRSIELNEKGPEADRLQGLFLSCLRISPPLTGEGGAGVDSINRVLLLKEFPCLPEAEPARGRDVPQSLSLLSHPDIGIAEVIMQIRVSRLHHYRYPEVPSGEAVSPDGSEGVASVVQESRISRAC